jgi:pyridoxamine 5'-phosphate oxidase
MEKVKEVVAEMRINYSHGALRDTEFDPSPIVQFQNWFSTAKNCKEIIEANAMTLCTTTKDGFPSGRIVLLKV